MPILIAFGCSSRKPSTTDLVQAFRQNQYDFTDPEKTGYKNITFKLPKIFDVDYNKNYTFRNTAFRRQVYQLGVLFSVERFTENDLHSALFDEEVIGEDLLNGFHDAYVNRRIYSLHNSGQDFKEYLGKRSKFKGIIQTVTGESSPGYSQLYYTIATIQVKKEFYIFQMIGSKEMMGYVTDDFFHILSTVRS